MLELTRVLFVQPVAAAGSPKDDDAEAPVSVTLPPASTVVELPVMVALPCRQMLPLAVRLLGTWTPSGMVKQPFEAWKTRSHSAAVAPGTSGWIVATWVTVLRTEPAFDVGLADVPVAVIVQSGCV